ncbi:MAG: PKD domain-containing protein, partial [Bacteroidales bacterium]|nr:PKD domain-containing protein [Bacteroidales bacterium]
IYIYHSLDYGETYTVYHPVSIGPDPIYTDFIAEDTLVEPGDTVQFTDLSNDAETWEWDFDNDGTIDSYEQNPTYIYQDTGYYTVKLSITGEAIQDYGIRYDYIHVDDLTGLEDNIRNDNNKIQCYPNPFSSNLNIHFSETKRTKNIIDIYNNQGELINEISGKQTITWDGCNKTGQKCLPGIYYIKVNSSIHKVILTK